MSAAFWLGWLLPTYDSIIRIYQSLFTRFTTAPSRLLSYDDYTVAWICALPVEMAAAQALLDEVHQDLPSKPKDNNAYILGRMGKHNIVIAGLPFGDYGNASATVVATQLISSFQSVRFALVVGIGGGVPSENKDIRLGDIVVGKPGIKHGGVAYLIVSRHQRMATLNECTCSISRLKYSQRHL